MQLTEAEAQPLQWLMMGVVFCLLCLPSLLLLPAHTTSSLVCQTTTTSPLSISVPLSSNNMYSDSGYYEVLCIQFEILK
jgi:hypothetical protein